MLRTIKVGTVVLLTMLTALGCQSPTDPDEVIVVDDFVDASQSPDPANAAQGDGRLFERPRADLPSEFLPYDWKTTFNVELRVNSTADHKDLSLKFPIEITSVAIAVQQCSNGIVIPPSGDAIYSVHDVASSTGNSFSGINTANTLRLDVWYDLPNGRREACIDVTVGLKWNNDDDVTVTGSKVVRVRVAA